MKILRKLGFKDFYKYDEIVSMLVEDDSQQVFTKRQYVLFMKTESERLWMIGSKHTYILFLILVQSMKYCIKDQKIKISKMVTSKLAKVRNMQNLFFLTILKSLMILYSVVELKQL